MFYTEQKTPQILRVICAPTKDIDQSSALADWNPRNLNETASPLTAEETPEGLLFSRDGETLLSVKEAVFTPKEIYRYTFSNGKPKIVTKVTVDGERSFVENAETVKVGDAYGASISFSIDADEAIYGLGQQENGRFNYRNCEEYLYHNNMKIPMPVFLSSKNYAVFFDAACMMHYTERDNQITMEFDAVDKVDFYVISGDNFDELIAGIRSLTGHTPLLPRWAYGYIQSKERYKTQEEILETAARFKEDAIPLSCIVLDWLSWEEGKWGNKIFDKSRFADAKAMVEQLHKDGVKFMISIWPNCKEGCENNNEFAAKGKLLCNFSTYDAFDEEARDMYWKQCEKELFAAGTDAWWCDSTEPFTPDWNGLEKRPEAERYRLALESTNKYLDARNSSAYCVAHAKGIYEHQRQVSDKRVVNLTRAGYPGIQKYGTILWSGDIAATWETFRHQIAEGLSISMSGILNWTWDTGAFFAGNTMSWRKWSNATEGEAPWFWQGDFDTGVADLGYRELYTRWLQAAAFLPVMRSHGTDTPREPWQFGAKGSKYYDSIVYYIRLRYRLLPYIYSLAIEASLRDQAMLRSLMFDFSADPAVREIKDAFMLGKSFYVCPVTEPVEYGPGSTPLVRPQTREVYLPAGADWYDFETGKQYAGGQKILADAPVARMPVYVKAGSILPVSAGTNGQCDKILVYAGADASCDFYNDSGDGYAYETEGFQTLHFVWNDRERTLSAFDWENCPAEIAVPVEVIG